MKKLLIVHLTAFIGILMLLFALYIADLSRGTTQRAPAAAQVTLNIFGATFLATAVAIWLYAWYVVIKAWKRQAIERNLAALALLLIGNVFGGYYILYKNHEAAKKNE
jgi:hypothetical protein